MNWPTMMPPDLRRRVEEILSERSPCAADVWTEVRDWLIRHGAEAPAELPTDRPGDGPPKFY
jgi:hypothetical protein